MDDAGFKRLEQKVDRLTEAITNLVRIEERQLSQGQRLGNLEERMSVVETAGRSTDRKVDQWVNRGIGVWALAAVIFAFAKGFIK
ncbi:MAG: hypothetical protein HEQ39_09675 [Rhizobacter sp.]